VKLSDKLRARLGTIAGDLNALIAKMSAEDYDAAAEGNAGDDAALAKLQADAKKVKGQLDNAVEAAQASCRQIYRDWVESLISVANRLHAVFPASPAAPLCHSGDRRVTRTLARAR
jgi:hypothetical protein